MKTEKYNQAIKILEEHDDFICDFEGASDDIIKKAQLVLGINFPEDYKLFLSCFGTLTFGSTEIYGVFREDFENSGVPDAVWFTLDERKLVNLPKHLVIIYNTGMEEMFCMNYKKLNSYDEPKITSYFPGFSEEEQRNEIIYDNFGEFLLDMVNEEIK